MFFFLLANFAKFRPEKYDFDLYKGIFMEKKKKRAKIRQILKTISFFSKLPDFHDKFQY
jgi:hypothetical protein